MHRNADFKAIVLNVTRGYDWLVNYRWFSMFRDQFIFCIFGKLVFENIFKLWDWIGDFKGEYQT